MEKVKFTYQDQIQEMDREIRDEKSHLHDTISTLRDELEELNGK